MLAVADLMPGVRRVTLDAPAVTGHVHCYLLRGADGWTLVDAGLGGPGGEAAWREVTATLDAPLRAVVVTHLHVDHYGGAAAAAAHGGAPVLQGRLDREQAAATYGDPAWASRVAAHAEAHGLPAAERPAVEAAWRALASLAQMTPARALDPGDLVAGWEVVALPGHADGHIGLLREGVLVGGDALLEGISPQIGVWPGADPDPLGAYLGTLERLRRRPPRVVLPGHGEPVAAPAARAAEIAAHHRDRLDAVAAALGPEPRTAHDVSLVLWPGELDPVRRVLAQAEALAHLERLAREGRALRAAAADGRAGFSGPAPPRRSPGAAPSR